MSLVSWLFASSLKDLELNRDFNGEDYEYEDEAKLVIFPDHFEIPLPNIEELPALVSESVLPLQCTLMVPWVAGWSPRLSCRATIWSQSFLHSRLKNICENSKMNFILEDWWVTCEMYTFIHLCFLYLCKHFGEPWGAPVCALFSVFIACMEHRRDFSHIY